MLSFIKNLFVGKPVQPEVEAPYKVEALPAGTEAAVVTAAEAVVVVADAVVPAAVEALEAEPAKKTAKPKALPKIKIPKVPK
jgi:hypothetical protein